ncbi:MAG: response regulator [Sedimentisphaerales bacterium]|nr:response regulator [Sedimentisphaerales bacterium]
MDDPAKLSSSVGRQKILVLCGRQSPPPEFLQQLQPYAELTTVHHVDEALDRLKNETFDAVLSETADFLPLERAAVSQQASAILNTIGEGVCIVAPDGTVLWANRQMEQFGDFIRQAAARWSQDACLHFQKRLGQAPDDPAAAHGLLRPLRNSLTVQESNHYFEMVTTAMLNSQGRLMQVATVVWDATVSRRLQQRLDAIDKAGRELTRLEADTLVGKNVEQRISLIQDKIVRYAKTLLNFDHFVVRVLDRKTNKLEVLFGVGLPQDEQMDLFVNSQGNGITGYVAATGRSYICNNPQTDPHYLPGLDGARSSLTVPLQLHDKVIGTLNVESHRDDTFTEDDRQVAEIFGRYIAIALNILDLLVVERYQTTGQTAVNLGSLLTEPLSKIMTDASLLLEDYIGHDDLRHRLQGIVDGILSVKHTIQEMQSAPRGIIDRRTPTAPPNRDLLGKRILVVDDEECIRQSIADVAQNCGCQVDIAPDGREALALLGRCGYDLVISDIKLPHSDGYQIFAAARGKDTPVIFMTAFGYDPSHSIVRANQEGLAAVLFKPFKADILLQTICKALDAPNAQP